jgi:hypothetical protein
MKKLGTPSVAEVPSVAGRGGVREDGDGGAAVAAPWRGVRVCVPGAGACSVLGCLDVARGCFRCSTACGVAGGAALVLVVGVELVGAGDGGSGLGGAGTVVVPVVVPVGVAVVVAVVVVAVVGASWLGAVTTGSTCALATGANALSASRSAGITVVSDRRLISVAEQVVEEQAARF